MERYDSKETHEAIGTIELFHRDAADYFTDCGLLRLDIRSDYEMSDKIIKNIKFDYRACISFIPL